MLANSILCNIKVKMCLPETQFLIHLKFCESRSLYPLDHTYILNFGRLKFYRKRRLLFHKRLVHRQLQQNLRSR